MILEYNIVRVGRSSDPQLERDINTRVNLTDKQLDLFAVDRGYRDKFQLESQVLSPDLFRLSIKRVDKVSGWGQDLHIAYQISDGDGRRSASEKIPKKIFITYKHKRIPSKVVSNLRNLNPGFSVTFFDDRECGSFLRKHFSAQFAALFAQIPDGPIKGDMVRICFLYIFGGVYYDIDIHPYQPISSILKEGDITFCTARSAGTQRNVFQGFIACSPENPITRACVNRFYLNIYTRYKYWPWSGTGQMYRILLRFLGRNRLSSTVYRKNGQAVKILEEFRTGSSRSVKYGGTVLFKNKYSDYRRHSWISGKHGKNSTSRRRRRRRKRRGRRGTRRNRRKR